MFYRPPQGMHLARPSFRTSTMAAIQINNKKPLTRNYLIPISEKIQKKVPWPLVRKYYHVGAKLVRMPPSQEMFSYHDKEINTYGSWGIVLKLSPSRKLIRLLER